MKRERRDAKRSSSRGALAKATGKIEKLLQPSFAVYRAVVKDVRDPLGQGRVKVVVPGVSRTALRARVATLMAGNECGTWFVPSKGDQVLVAFESGDLRLPCVLGCFWDGANRPPEAMDKAGQNYKRSIRSKGGLKITLNDKDASLTLETRAGQKVVLTEWSQSIIVADPSGNEIRMEPSGITLTAAAKLKLEATTVEIAASQVEVNAGVCKASGVVECDSLIANSVVASSYTPGAGNIW
jgi:uncharacterized protein involved in type VI secretion and phage assembly